MVAGLVDLWACTGTFDANGSDGPTGQAGPGGSGSHGPDPRQLFVQTVQPILDQACGVCHHASSAGPPFLAGIPDEYTTVKMWPGLVGSTPESSHMYTKGQHEGPALTPDQSTTIATWIRAEAAAGQASSSGPPPVQTVGIAPFAPISGPNTVDLSSIGAGLAGTKLTFDAAMPAGGIRLSSITLVAPATTGVHALHPLFTEYPAMGNPQPDRIDSFAGLDMTVPAGSSGTVGSGLLVMSGFGAGDQIAVGFQTLAATSGSGDGDGTGGGGCKDVASFTANAKTPLQSTCVTCHGGANAGAVAAVDMSQVSNGSATAQATACAQIKTRIDPNTPAQSQIFTVPGFGSNAVHPFKFADQTTFNAFQQMVSQWIVREK